MIMRRTSLPMTRVRPIDRLSLPSIVFFIFLPFLGDYHKQDVHPPDDCSRHQTVDVPHEERQKKWYDLDDKRKKELEVQILPFSSFPCAVSPSSQAHS